MQVQLQIKKMCLLVMWVYELNCTIKKAPHINLHAPGKHIILVNKAATLHIIILEVRLVYVSAAGFLDVLRSLCCRCSWHKLSPGPHSSHCVYTVNTRAYSLDSCIMCCWVSVCIQCVYVCLRCISAYSSSLICYPCGFNMRVITVDTALLRRRLAVLLWADIRASMSSSASSSENSCGWQHSDLIKRKLDLGSWLVSLYLAVFFFFSHTAALCGGVCSQLP